MKYLNPIPENLQCNICNGYLSSIQEKQGAAAAEKLIAHMQLGPDNPPASIAKSIVKQMRARDWSGIYASVSSLQAYMQMCLEVLVARRAEPETKAEVQFIQQVKKLKSHLEWLNGSFDTLYNNYYKEGITPEKISGESALTTLLHLVTIIVDMRKWRAQAEQEFPEYPIPDSDLEGVDMPHFEAYYGIALLLLPAFYHTLGEMGKEVNEIMSSISEDSTAINSNGTQH